jgi:hypothetical protein
MNESPLGYIVRNFSNEKITTKAFYFFIAMISFVLILKVFIIPVQKRFLEQFHLKSSSYFSWAVLQAFPSMYNYENHIKFYDWDTTVNHFPLRIITFSPSSRKYIYKFLEDHYLEIRSQYQSQELKTNYILSTTPQGYQLKRLESHASQRRL